MGVTSNETGALPRKQEPAIHPCLPRGVAAAPAAAWQVEAEEQRVFCRSPSEDQVRPAHRRSDLEDESRPYSLDFPQCLLKLRSNLQGLQEAVAESKHIIDQLAP